MKKNKKRGKSERKKAVYCQNLANELPFLYLHKMKNIKIARFSVASAQRRGGSPDRPRKAKRLERKSTGPIQHSLLLMPNNRKFQLERKL
jgi:hypothetical protein